MLDLIGKLLNPIGLVIEVGVKALGLPPEIANAAKIGIGALTGNVAGVIDGVTGLAGNIQDRVASTEYQASTPEAAKAGYATRPPPDPLTLEFKKHLETIQNGFALLEAAQGNLGWVDGRFDYHDLAGVLQNPDIPQNLKDAARFLLDHPELLAQLDTAAGIGGKDRFVGTADIQAKLNELNAQLADSVSLPGSWKPPTPLIGAAPPDVAGKGHLAADFLDYVDALNVLQANYKTFDSANGNLDGAILRSDLEAIAKDPNASPDIRKAAKFLLDHPEYFNRLEMSAGIHVKDGVIGPADVRAALAQAESDLATFGPPAKVGKGSGPKSDDDEVSETKGGKTPAGSKVDSKKKTNKPGSSVQDILKNPNMTVEEKIQAILARIMENADQEILEVMDQMAAVNDDNAGLGTEKKEDKKKAAKNNSTLEQLQLRLQKVTERRKQMFDLMTNMSTVFNEMAKHAIANLARA